MSRQTDFSLVSWSRLGALDAVDADVVVRPAGVQVIAGLVPGEGSAAELLLGTSLVGEHRDGVNILQELGAWQVKHLDAFLSADDKPVELLREEDAVDWGFAVVLGEPLALDEVPDHDEAVAGAGCEVARAVNHIKRVDLSLVAGERVQQVHVSVVPHLDGLVPRGSDAKGRLLGVVELDAGDSIGVLVPVNDVLALAAGVPDSNCFIQTAGDDLAVIWGQRDGQNIFGVSSQTIDGSAIRYLPEAASSVPGRGKGEARVASQLNLGNEVRVACITVR